MNEIKQASIYLRVIWLNDNENLRPDSLNIKLDGENTEDVVFSISQSDNSVGNDTPWETNEWANGITYNYQKIIENEDNSQPQEENSPKTEEINEIKENNIPYVIPSVINIPNNYRCNILKNAETETYSYYTIKMTYIPPKPRKMLRSASSTTTLNFNGTTIENVNFNGTKVEKVVFNGTTVFEKKKADFASLILANSTLNEGTPDFSLTATTDEGMFATEDNDGTSYYFRGAVNNNYVKFAGFWWQIMRINGDGTIRLVYFKNNANSKIIPTNNTIYGYLKSGGFYNMGFSNILENLRWSNSNLARNELETWFNNTFNDVQLDKITESKFWNDLEIEASTKDGNDKYSATFLASKRLTENLPTLICNDSNDLLSLMIGTLNLDEFMFAGNKLFETNKENYLSRSESFWLITPKEFKSTTWSSKNVYNYYFSCSSSAFSTNYISYINLNGGNIASYKTIPVINLKADVQVTGTGTMEDPYVVVGAE